MSEEPIPPLLTTHGAILRSLVATYCGTERNNNLTAFTIHGPYVPAAASASAVAQRPGCYVIYTALGEMKYIGMANKIGYRSCHHFRSAVQAYPFWQYGHPATFIDLIAVCEIWEPHSLEAYLTVKTAELRKVTQLPSLWLGSDFT